MFTPHAFFLVLFLISLHLIHTLYFTEPRYKNSCTIGGLNEKLYLNESTFILKIFAFKNAAFYTYLCVQIYIFHHSYYIIPSHIIERYTCVIHKKILFTSWIVVQKWSNNKLRLLSNFMIQVVTFPPKLRFRKHNLNINTIPTFTISVPFEVDNHIR